MYRDTNNFTLARTFKTVWGGALIARQYVTPETLTKAVRDDATPVFITYYHTDSYKNTCGFSTKKKPANPHRNLTVSDYQCVTNDPVAPSRMRTHLRLARQTTVRASARNRGDAYRIYTFSRRQKCPSGLYSPGRTIILRFRQLA